MEITVPDGFLMKEELIEQLTTQMLDLISPKADKTALEAALADISQLKSTVGEVCYPVDEEVKLSPLTPQGFVTYSVQIPQSAISISTRAKRITIPVNKPNGVESFYLNIKLPEGGRYFVAGTAPLFFDGGG